MGWDEAERGRSEWEFILTLLRELIEFLEEKVAHNEIISRASNFYEKSSWKNFAHQLIMRGWQLWGWRRNKFVTIFLEIFLTHSSPPQMVCIFPLSVSHFSFRSESGTKPLRCLIASVYLRREWKGEWKQVTRLFLLSVQIKSTSVDFLIVDTPLLPCLLPCSDRETC